MNKKIRLISLILCCGTLCISCGTTSETETPVDETTGTTAAVAITNETEETSEDTSAEEDDFFDDVTETEAESTTEFSDSLEETSETNNAEMQEAELLALAEDYYQQAENCYKKLYFCNDLFGAEFDYSDCFDQYIAVAEPYSKNEYESVLNQQVYSVFSMNNQELNHSIAEKYLWKDSKVYVACADRGGNLYYSNQYNLKYVGETTEDQGIVYHFKVENLYFTQESPTDEMGEFQDDGNLSVSEYDFSLLDDGNSIRVLEYTLPY